MYKTKLEKLKKWITTAENNVFVAFTATPFTEKPSEGEKLLEIEAEVAGVTAEASLLNPLANQDLSPADTRMLEAKQQFNAALLKSGGKLPKEVVIAYAKAALAACAACKSVSISPI